jgi:hypothetical protein
VPLIFILLLIALVALLFTARYPKGLYHFVMGINRWGMRVRAYTSLTRDEYPPLCLDMAPREPESVKALDRYRDGLAIGEQCGGQWEAGEHRHYESGTEHRHHVLRADPDRAGPSPVVHQGRRRSRCRSVCRPVSMSAGSDYTPSPRRPHAHRPPHPGSRKGRRCIPV